MEGRTAEDLEAQPVATVVAGRMMSVRLMGKASFFHISDAGSKIQVYIRADKAGAEAYERFKLLDIGDIIAVAGTLFKTRTGELTVLCASFTFLAKCLHPLPEKWHGLQDVEIRYRRRYLDLMMNPEVGESSAPERDHLLAPPVPDSRGYVEVETPMLQPIAGRGDGPAVRHPS